MVVTSTEELVDLLQKSELLEGKQLEQARAAVQSEDEPVDAAKRWVDAGFISEWQGAQLVAGRSSFYLGKYRLIRLLGRGGMGGVFLAEHTTMNRRVALKTISREFGNTPGALEQFLLEARTIAALDHPNICQAYSFDQESGRFFLVMEFIEGKDLKEVVEEQGPLESSLAADYARQAAEGLQHGHDRKIVHCDIKPSNLLLNEKGVIKIVDMGMSRLQDPGKAEKDSSEQQLLGSVDYLAPEQAMGAKDFDHRADIYSLGCTLYFLLTGRPPFPEGMLHEKLMKHQAMTPESITKFRSDVPEKLLAICEKMMAKKPDERYQAAEEVGKLLAEFPPPKMRRKARPAAPLKRAEPLPEQAGGAAVPANQTGAQTIAGRQSGARKAGLLKKTQGKIIAAVVAVGLLVLLAILIPRLLTSLDSKEHESTDDDWLTMNNQAPPKSSSSRTPVLESGDTSRDMETVKGPELSSGQQPVALDQGKATIAEESDEKERIAQSAGTGAGTVLLDDHFDNGDLATGGPDDTNAGFKLVANSVGGGGAVTESGSGATVKTTGGNNNAGIVSIHTFDPTSDPATGLTVTWTVARTDPPEANGLNFTVQANGGFFNRGGGQPNVLMKFLGGSFRLVAHKGSGAAALANDRVTMSEVLDGFTLTATFNAAGWSYSAKGLDSLADKSGNWTDTHNYNTLFDGTTHVGGFIQQGKSPRTLVINRITVTSGKGGAGPPELPVAEDGALVSSADDASAALEEAKSDSRVNSSTSDPRVIPVTADAHGTQGLDGLLNDPFAYDMNNPTDPRPNQSWKGGSTCYHHKNQTDAVLAFTFDGSYDNLFLDIYGRDSCVDRDNGLTIEFYDGSWDVADLTETISGFSVTDSTPWHSRATAKPSTQADRILITGPHTNLTLFELRAGGIPAATAFLKLSETGNLGPLQTGVELPDHQTIGELTLTPEQTVDLKLIGGRQAIPSPRTFEMHHDDAKGYWVIYLRDENSTDSAKQAAVAAIDVRDQKILFRWAQGAPSKAGYLLNCGLEITVDGRSRFLPLGRVEQVQPVVIYPASGTGKIVLPKDRLPKSDSLRLQIVRLDGFPKDQQYSAPSEVAKPRRAAHKLSQTPPSEPQPGFEVAEEMANPPAAALDEGKTLKPGQLTGITFPKENFPAFGLRVVFLPQNTIEVTSMIVYPPNTTPVLLRPNKAGQYLLGLTARETQLSRKLPKKGGREPILAELKPIRDLKTKFENLGTLYKKLTDEPPKLHFHLYMVADDGHRVLLMRSYPTEETETAEVDSSGEEP